MNPAMKQRLVGTLVLGSLALILIPLLLDGEGIERPPLSATIPPAPIIDTTLLPEPARPLILADALAPEAEIPTGTPVDGADAAVDAAINVPEDATVDTTVDATTDTATETPAELARTEPEPAPAPAPEPAPVAEAPPQSANAPALAADGLPEAWALRLGVFSERANADGLLKRLQDAGHKAFIRPVGTLNGVFVGPLLTRNEAVALQSELKARFQISDVIVQRFDIAQ